MTLPPSLVFLGELLRRQVYGAVAASFTCCGGVQAVIALITSRFVGGNKIVVRLASSMTSTWRWHTHSAALRGVKMPRRVVNPSAHALVELSMLKNELTRNHELLSKLCIQKSRY